MPAPDTGPTEAADTGLAALDEVLRTTCADAESAARTVVETARSCGIRLHMRRRIGDRWAALAGPSGDDGPVTTPMGRLVPDDPDHVVAIVSGSLPPAVRAALERAVVWVGLHLARDNADVTASDALHESSVLRAVTEQLRSVADLDQVLHLIVTRTLDLLDSDICGVMLLDGVVVRMRSCVGHRTADTARLVMAAGQGLAGLVLATGEPGRVDDYLQASTISDDFMSLADRESAKSALAVPLAIKGDLIGVLEVWRRRPSVFTDSDVDRLQLLAGFAAIAIDNARLLEDQQSVVEQLRGVRVELEHEVHISRKTAVLQQALLDAVLDGPTMATIADVVASEIGCVVGIYGPDGQLIASRPSSSARQLPKVLKPRGRARWLTEEQADQRCARVHPIIDQGETLGSVVLSGSDGDGDLLQVACSQVAMACSLAQLQARAASRARAEALEQVFADLLRGTLEQRLAARSRAQHMGVPLAGPHRVVAAHVRLRSQDATEAAIDRVSAQLARLIRACPVTPPQTIVTSGGDQVVALVPTRDDLPIRELLHTWTERSADKVGECELTWGASKPHDDPLTLSAAYQEAQTALTAARSLGAQPIAAYDELGIVRLLLGTGREPDFRTFMDEVTGPLLEYDAKHDGSLIPTLRAFFDADCSQRVAAERLFIHHKTMRYRLARINQLTGLDLAKHEDRLRADVALRILEVAGGETPAR